MVFTPSPVSKSQMQTACSGEEMITRASVSTIDHVFEHSAASINSMNVDYAANKPLEVDQCFLELNKSLATQFSLSRLLSPVPSIFSGDPLSYPSWKRSFEALIEQRQNSPVECWSSNRGN